VTLGLASTYVQATSRIPEIFQKIRDGQAPERFTQQLLKDWGLVSSNDRAFIPLLKTLGFLTADGKPTQRYNDYRDHSRSKEVMAQALRDAYSDIFLIKEHPSESDKVAIEGKFKSFHNTSNNVASLSAKTFLALLPLADLKSKPGAGVSSIAANENHPEEKGAVNGNSQQSNGSLGVPGLHYNIQVHLPATKDIEVYNAIFKSLRQHLFDE
jgi:hypothetical protein